MTKTNAYIIDKNDFVISSLRLTDHTYQYEDVAENGAKLKLTIRSESELTITDASILPVIQIDIDGVTYARQYFGKDGLVHADFDPPLFGVSQWGHQHHYGLFTAVKDERSSYQRIFSVDAKPRRETVSFRDLGKLLVYRSEPLYEGGTSETIVLSCVRHHRPLEPEQKSTYTKTHFSF